MRTSTSLLCTLACVFGFLASAQAASRVADGANGETRSRWADAEASVDVRVDPRVELLSIIFRLAGNPEYNQNTFPKYVSEIEAHFGTFRDHPAIEYARQLRQERGVSFDAVMSMAIHLTEPPELEERVPLEHAELDKRWQLEEAHTFIEHARRFAQDSRFENFIQLHQPLYELAVLRMQALIEDQLDLEWFTEFFGERPQARFVVAIGLANGGGNYGPKFRTPDGSEELYAILGTWLTDEEGMPVYDETITGTIIHEFNHAFINPIVSSHLDELQEAGEAMYAVVADQMQRQAYGTWKTLIDESLVRAAVARYRLRHEGATAAVEEVEEQQARAFLWMDELYALLGVYEHARSRYADFTAFFPDVVAYFRDLALRIDAVAAQYEANRPHVISTEPANGSENVDPTVTQIKVVFDRPMMPSNYSFMTIGEQGEQHFPETTGTPSFDETGTVLTLPVKLKPDWIYKFSLNSETGGAFQSEGGIPLKAYVVEFATGSGQE